MMTLSRIAARKKPDSSAEPELMLSVLGTREQENAE
jgi:hypothetical protein